MTDEEVPQSDLPEDMGQTSAPQAQAMASSGQPVPAEDLPPASGEAVPAHDLPIDEAKYSTPSQQALTGIEGLGRGVTGGLSDALAVGMRKAATAFGVPDEYLHYVAPKTEDIANRQEVNPVESKGTEIAGNIALMTRLPQIGSKAISTAIQMMGLGAGNEISKSILGHGDPVDSVGSRIAFDGATGLLGGAIFGKLEQPALKALNNAKLGTRLSSFLYGVGHAASLPAEESVSLAGSALNNAERKGLNDGAFKLGQTFYKELPATIAATSIGASGGFRSGIEAFGAEKYFQKFLNPYLSKASEKYVGPAVLRAAGAGVTEKLGQVLDHATAIGKGANKITGAVDALFKAGGTKAIDEIISERDREKLREFIENGGIGTSIMSEAQDMGVPTQEFAKGGEVKPILDNNDPVAKVFPEQNVLLNSAKARVSNYLNSVRPMPKNKLPFDSVHKDPKADKDYNEALDMANKPLTILNHIKSGSLTPKHMKMFTSMYPELHSHLSKKITEKITNIQTDDTKKPSRQVRQALSLFTGANLSSSLTPQSIQAAQMVFARQNAQRSPPPSTKAPLSKAGSRAQLPEQARTQALNKT